MMPQPYAYASVEDIGTVYGMTAANIYSHANRDHWRRIRYHGRVLYKWVDVHDTHSRLDKPSLNCKSP